MALPASLNSTDFDYNLAHYRSELFFQDFPYYVTADEYTTVNVAGSGTVAADDTGGTTNVLITSGATAANSTAVRSTLARYLPQLGRPGRISCKLNFTNVATNNGVLVFGLMSTTGLTITSGTADPSASYSGAIIYKLSGGDFFKVQTSNGSAKTTTQTINAGGDGNHILTISYNDRDGANANVSFTIDGEKALDANNKEIQHTLPYSALVKMYDAVMVQTTASAAQTCFVDYIGGEQLRLGTNV